MKNDLLPGDPFELPPRTLMIPLTDIQSEGADREALSSALRGLCEKNQVPMGVVLTRIPLPELTPYRDKADDRYPLHSANHGLKTTAAIANVIRLLTGFENASNLSFACWNQASGVNSLVAVSRTRKWCPACYLDDVSNGRRIYDRLAWMAQGVELCLRHNVYLEKACFNCSERNLPFMLRSDVAGYCPRCYAWLGGVGREFPRNREDLILYRRWIAGWVSELLVTPTEPLRNLNQNIATSIDALVDRHFNGNGHAAARYLSRSHSIISQWRNGRITPSWGALSEVSYAFQTPVRALISGDPDAIAFSRLTPLPRELVQRRLLLTVNRRKALSSEIEAFMMKILEGGHPAVTKFRHIGEVHGLDRTTPRKLFPLLSKKIDAELRHRRFVAKEIYDRERRLVLTASVREITAQLLRERKRITIRNLVDEIRRRKLTIRHAESAWILKLAKEATPPP